MMLPARLFNCGCTTLAHLQSLHRHHLHPRSTRHGPSRSLHQSGPCRGIWNKSNRRFKHRNRILFSGRRPRFCTKPPLVRPTMNLRNGGQFVVGAMVLGPFYGPPVKRTDPDVARNVSTWMATPVQVAASPRPTCPPSRLRQPVAKKTKDPQLAGILKACQPSDISSDYKSASQLVDRFPIPLCIFRLFRSGRLLSHMSAYLKQFGRLAELAWSGYFS